MAEINIQPKSSSNAMWWILAIVGLLIVGWFLFAGNANTAPRTTTSEQRITAPEDGSAVPAVVFIAPAPIG
jgi:hypothetical protein